jgi:hypothetical protein
LRLAPSAIPATIAPARKVVVDKVRILIVTS